MDQILSKLNNEEKELVYKGPLLVCILIAGADGKIDKKEINEAVQMSREHHWVKSALSGIFTEVAKDFEDKLKIVIQSYPVDDKKRNKLVLEELNEMNKVLNKLGPEFSTTYVETLKYIAHRIASASGKFWSRITPEEAQLLDLPMIKVKPKI